MIYVKNHDMETIKKFLEWIKAERFDNMSDQQKEFFNNAFRWFDNIYTTYFELELMLKSENRYTDPTIELKFELVMDIVSLKRQYFNEYKYNGLPF